MTEISLEELEKYQEPIVEYKGQKYKFYELIHAKCSGVCVYLGWARGGEDSYAKKSGFFNNSVLEKITFEEMGRIGSAFVCLESSLVPYSTKNPDSKEQARAIISCLYNIIDDKLEGGVERRQLLEKMAEALGVMPLHGKECLHDKDITIFLDQMIKKYARETGK